jgi:hypothetical protein
MFSFLMLVNSNQSVMLQNRYYAGKQRRGALPNGKVMSRDKGRAVDLQGNGFSEVCQILRVSPEFKDVCHRYLRLQRPSSCCMAHDFLAAHRCYFFVTKM